MLTNRLRHFILLGLFATALFPNDSRVRSARDIGTKYLVFPEGSNVQLVYCLTISTYSKPQGMFTIGVTAGLAWELPTYRNTALYGKPAEVYHRRSRRELYRKVELMLRTDLSGKFASSLRVHQEKSNASDYWKAAFSPASRRKCFCFPKGKDGKACVLKAICGAARRGREDIGKGSFLEEMLHTIFTLPGGWYNIDPMTEYERAYHLGENCDQVHVKCPGVF